MITNGDRIATIFFNLAHFFLLMPLWTLILFYVLSSVGAPVVVWILFWSYTVLAFMYSFCAIYLNVRSVKRRRDGYIPESSAPFSAERK